MRPARLRILASTSVSTFGCASYSPAINPYQINSIGASCSVNSSSLEYVGRVYYGTKTTTNGGCGSKAYLSFDHYASSPQSPQSCLGPATLYVSNYYSNGTLANSTVTYPYMTLACSTDSNSANNLRSDVLATLGLSVVLSIIAPLITIL